MLYALLIFYTFGIMTRNFRSKAGRGLLLSFFTLGLFQQQSSAQELDNAKLDQYFQNLETNNKFMGSVALSKDGKVIYTHSTGMADVATGRKNTDQSVYRIGSISKVFTAAMIFKAIEEKKLSLDKKLSDYFPSIKNADKITIGQLLQHRSGIHNFTDDGNYLSWNTKPQTEAQILDIIVAAGSDFEPDSKAAYSNSNYVLLSYILQKVYKKPYAKLLEEKIIKPLGLAHTYYGGKTDPAKNESYSYNYTGNWTKEAETDMSVPMGAGAIVSTPQDLTRFVEGLFAGKIISSKSLEQMKESLDGYGRGLFMVPFNGKKGYGHTGGIDGFSSVAAYFPEDKIAYALTCNGNNYENNNISIAMLSAAYGQSFDIPVFKNYAVNASDLDTYAGFYGSTEIPLKITIAKQGSILTAQATGQPSFPLEATDKHQFQFEQAGVEISFDPEAHTMIMKQRGHSFHFTKE